MRRNGAEARSSRRNRPQATIRRSLLALATLAAIGGRAIAADPVQKSAGTAQEGSRTRSLEERIAELEALVARLQAEIQSMQSASGVEAGRSAGTATLDELQKRIDALTQEIERLRIGEAAATGQPAPQPVAGFGPAASKVYALKRGVSIGGYGDMLYQGFASRRDDGTPSDATDTLDLERAVLYFGYKWTDHLLFNSEVEYEHAVAGEGEPGETAVEFAYIDYHPLPHFGMRGGLLLVPVGFLTELHEPPIFHGARRPEVETEIIPSTWRENGVGVYGEFGRVTYRAYVVASLDASGFTSDEWIREGRQEGANSRAEDLALTARVDWNPSPGILLGASDFTGGCGQGDPALGNPRVTLWDGHAEWNARGVHLRGLYARGTLSDADAVSLARGMVIGSRAKGWYVEAAYNLLAPSRRSDMELSPFVRYEALDTQEEVAPGFARDPANDRTVKTFGVTFRPLPNVAIKTDVQDFGNRAGTAIDQFNFALGYLF
jgi:uncharacterized small protein (DUF1192 family)